MQFEPENVSKNVLELYTVIIVPVSSNYAAYYGYGSKLMAT